MKNNIAFILITLMLSSCLGLDDNLFNPDTSITEYQFDSFTGKQEIDADTFTVDSNQIHLMTFTVGSANEKIYAVYIGDTSKISTDSVILYLHGNAGHMDFYWPRAKLLANVGARNNFGVLMIDYRGFGLSDGKPSELNMYEDSDNAIQWLKEKGLTEDRFFIYGFSLGSAPTCELTANVRTMAPSKIMLESPFASAEVMVQDGSGLALPSSYFVELEIDNAEEIKNISQPLYWIHGTEDDFLALKTHGEVVYKNHSGSYKEAHRIEGGVHSDVPKAMGYEKYITSLNAFLTK